MARRQNADTPLSFANTLAQKFVFRPDRDLMRSTMLAISPFAHASEAPPHNISAANLNVIQNDSGNTADSVTVSQKTGVIIICKSATR